MNDYCLATYRCFDEKADFHKKAQSIAVGLTVGSWTDLPEAQKKSMEPHLGLVIDVKIFERGANPALQDRYADIQIAYPDVNFSRDIPALLVTVFGKLSMDGRIKLLNLSFSPAFLAAFPGPKFGIQGVRNALDVQDRPLLMSIFKSVIGHDVQGLREQFLQQALGGVDLIKDDEILFENPLTPLTKRVEICMEAAKQAEAETGQKLLYAVNLTGSTSRLAEQAERAIAAGANALLFNVLAYGFDTLHELSTNPNISVPIMAHPAMAGAFYPSPHHGVSASLLLGKLMRIAGADLVLFPSPYGSVVMPKDENMAIKHDLLTTHLEQDYMYAHTEGIHLVPSLKTSFPVPSAGIHPGLVPLILKDFGHEVVVNAGGGVHGHPMGAAAGGRAFRQAIDANLNGSTLVQYAEDHPELQAAITAWGVKE
ncbi:2,3-diketo-5-methylthiopentyl-1-phosphate enolase [Paenibacillus psychroresistens]|uniref:2,3-diketo-5-methylthiopentyl-1-phosphate enolase n=1 Tax=Paenibacillus psychroresistens TaxID=1778678 RepID=A0A6B8RMQ5_9BACL|nr:2,3-diketo-5-methylthiopentyl-1-phosphate enolase [Paenibacillus psychroresistens]QGQ96825.1 2,3-diketo-5-methylthiopentyl-1-phosphate enolase [Paenibacillus psychroresistens]